MVECPLCAGRMRTDVVDEWHGMMAGTERVDCPLCNNKARTNRANTAGTIRITMTNDRRNT